MHIHIYVYIYLYNIYIGIYKNMVTESTESPHVVYIERTVRVLVKNVLPLSPVQSRQFN